MKNRSKINNLIQSIIHYRVVVGDGDVTVTKTKIKTKRRRDGGVSKSLRVFKFKFF